MPTDNRLQKIVRYLEDESYFFLESYLLDIFEEMLEEDRTNQQLKEDLMLVHTLAKDFDRYYLKQIGQGKLLTEAENDQLLKISWNKVLLKQIIRNMHLYLLNRNEPVEVRDDLSTLTAQLKAELKFYRTNRI